ncbi:EexN family lipoprotein [Pistricoccus aurantiacus]|uniref:EexN family lipoprotein n=1 Tax=Pistricoccus aurantiacus TaxID=1883414 RepID=UPI00362D2DA4
MNISYVRNFAAVAMVSFALTGCFDDTPDIGPVQTVDWYKEHVDERKVTLETCGNNPGELKDTPNCINALQAERALSSGEPFELDLSSLKSEEDA